MGDQGLLHDGGETRQPLHTDQHSTVNSQHSTCSKYCQYWNIVVDVQRISWSYSKCFPTILFGPQVRILQLREIKIYYQTLIQSRVEDLSPLFLPSDALAVIHAPPIRSTQNNASLYSTRSKCWP